MESSLQQFAETDTLGSFTLQNSKLLKVHLDQVTVQAKLGSMVAYQGDVTFEHAGAGGVGRFIKKAMTGEGTQLMKVSGSGEVFLADTVQDVHLLRLENERITCNGRNVLAFDAGISWDIQRVQGGAAGALAGGLFNMTLEGSGFVALITDGPPVLLDVASASTFADAQAAVAWSGSVTTALKADVSLKTMIGRGSGETFQVGFSGTGWVLVQPSEGRVAVATTK
jgi:uncharacterized protein (AIM24 family)